MIKNFATYLALCSASFTSVAQVTPLATLKLPMQQIVGTMPAPPQQEVLLTPVKIANHSCITIEESEAIFSESKKVLSTLKHRAHHSTEGGTSHVLHQWPIQAASNFTDYGYYTVQNLVDHNIMNPNQVLDYNCGSRTYDYSGGNHQGTDIIYWPYAWKKMDENVMEIIASAPGVITMKRNNFFDRNCANNGNSQWNGIILEHADGSQSWYLHFKTGSATTKSVGDTVQAGEYLGLAGSSGSSDWPHLHFQVMNALGMVIDPFDGTCNSTNAGDTWWQTQINYDVPSINRICTKKTPDEFYQCPTAEITYEADTFYIGDTLWLWAYMRDNVINGTVYVNIFNPQGFNMLNFQYTNTFGSYPTSYNRWFYPVTNWFTPGWWTYQIQYGGNSYSTTFYMTQLIAGTNDINFGKLNLHPNPSSNQITLTELLPGTNLEIVDALGRVVLVSKSADTKVSIDISNLPNGVYNLIGQYNEKRYSSRFIKN
ncbi:MAG: hypothetical protein RIQ89_650 [Bacteroidota bacterium]